MDNTNNVLVIGGTGFIGWHVTRLLLSKGYSVVVMSRKPQQAGIGQSKLSFVIHDMNNIKPTELKKLLTGMDAVVFAAGADVRTVTKKPAYDYFYRENVLPISKIGEAIKGTGVKKFLIMGSHASALNRTEPQLNLAGIHPYIRSRAEQLKMAMGFASDKLSVLVLELPNVLGMCPKGKPLWAPLVKYANTKLPFLFFTTGGIGIVSVRQVAIAVDIALQNEIHSGAYPIADNNYTWDELFPLLRNGKSIRVIHLKKWMLFPLTKIIELVFLLLGREMGLKLSAYLTIQTRNIFILPTDCMPGFIPNPTMLTEEINLTVGHS